MYGGKSPAEARVERLTWFLLVMIFAILNIVPPGTLPNATVPFAGALVLLGSGIYQYSRRWRVSPTTWVAGSVMLVFGLYNIYVNTTANLLGLSLIIFALVILIGLFTGET
jgi:hypothetical protein